GSLELEMTESHALLSAEATTRVLARLRALGVRLAIDDFGSGYASLSYLRRLPVHSVKLDRAFVRGIPYDPDNTAIASGVIDMAHALGLEVVAEGVETEEQRDFFERWGCDRLQGFLVSAALPPAELEAWLRRTGGRAGPWPGA
ncbi:MAG TPA: EAL domain-containing protein, partial [Thermoanaerobaculia bacterium]|nr:EAL domain-containing protein [Thermoanaerobaculia bacterium]